MILVAIELDLSFPYIYDEIGRLTTDWLWPSMWMEDHLEAILFQPFPTGEIFLERSVNQVDIHGINHTTMFVNERLLKLAEITVESIMVRDVDWQLAILKWQ